MNYRIRIEADIELSDYGTGTGGADAMLYMAAHVQDWRRLEKLIDEGFMRSVTFDTPENARRPGYGTVRIEARLLSMVLPDVRDVPALVFSPAELERQDKAIDAHLAWIAQHMQPSEPDEDHGEDYRSAEQGCS